MFKTDKKEVLKNVIEEGKKINPYFFEVTEAIATTDDGPIWSFVENASIYLPEEFKDFSLSEFYKEYTDAFFKITEFYLKELKDALNKYDEVSEKFKNAFLTWLNIESVLGDDPSITMTFRFGFSTVIGSILHALEVEGRTLPPEIKGAYEKIKRYHLAEMLKESTGKVIKFKDVRGSSTKNMLKKRALE